MHPYFNGMEHEAIEKSEFIPRRCTIAMVLPDPVEKNKKILALCGIKQLYGSDESFRSLCVRYTKFLNVNDTGHHWRKTGAECREAFEHGWRFCRTKPTLKTLQTTVQVGEGILKSCEELGRINAVHVATVLDMLVTETYVIYERGGKKKYCLFPTELSQYAAPIIISKILEINPF